MKATKGHTPLWRRGNMIYGPDNGPGTAPLVAQVYSGDECGVPLKYAIGAAEADRLAGMFALAPEMEAALAGAVEMIDEMLVGGLTRQGLSDLCKRHLTPARALLARLDGGADHA